MKNFLKRFFVIGMAVLFPLAASGGVDISDVPLAVRNNVSPNFVFIIDNSQSMTETVSGTRDSRLVVAKRAANAVVETLPKGNKVRVGIASFANEGKDRLGGELHVQLVSLGTDSKMFTDAVNKIELFSGTPLSETLAGMGRYLANASAGPASILKYTKSTTVTSVSVADFFMQNNTGRTSLKGAPTSCVGDACPVNNWCQRSNIIFMTDGEPTEDKGLSDNTYLGDFNGDKTKNLVDVAKALHEVDLRPDLTAPAGKTKGRNVTVYLIGFADASVKGSTLMTNAATAGGGSYLFAEKEDELVRAFRSAIDDAFAKESAAAAVSVVNTQVVLDNIAYASRYNSGSWSGDLMAYRLNTSTGIPIEPPVWEAAALLDARTAARNIVTYKAGSGGAVFNSSSTTALTADEIAYLRGDRSKEGTSFRSRGRLLGDIVNAESVVVKYANGQQLVFQGANDGMLHAFDGKLEVGGGEELWGYVPGALHGSLKKLTLKDYTHQFFVDATPAVADVDGKKLLIGGLGKGGKAYYALDITSPTATNEVGYASKVQWEVVPDSVKSGYSYATPLIVNTSNGWRVVVPSGYGNTDGKGYVFLLDPKDGSVKATISTGQNGELAFLAKLQNAGANDVIDVVYGGDTQGNVFRFDLKNNASVRIASLTDGSGVVQPVTSPPLVTADSDSGVYKVFVGTGQYLGDKDLPTALGANASAGQTQTLYGMVDNSKITLSVLPDIRGSNGASCPAGGGNGDFVCQQLSGSESAGFTTTSHALGSKKGWYVDLPLAGARITSSGAQSRAGVLVYTANFPTDAKCEPGGRSFLITLDPKSGGAFNKAKAMMLLSPALASRPVLVETADGERALVRHADQTFTSTKLPSLPGSTSTQFRVISWRELL